MPVQMPAVNSWLYYKINPRYKLLKANLSYTLIHPPQTQGGASETLSLERIRRNFAVDTGFVRISAH
jgi:hypothetical protein